MDDATGKRQLPEHRAREHRGGDRRAVFQAGRHHLVDTKPRQGPPHPHHEQHPQRGFQEEVAAADQPHEVVRGVAGPLAQAQQRGHGDRSVPAPHEEHGSQGAHEKHRAVFGHEKEAPSQARIFGVKAGDKFALRLGQIEGSTIHAGHGAGDVDPEDHESERVVEEIPACEPARLFLSDRDQVHAARQHHRHDHAHAQRHLVAHHLGRLTHGTEQRPLRGRRIPREDHTEDLQAEHGDHKKHPYVQPLAHEVKGKRQGDERTE